jgi:acyl-CoA thioesterase-1
MTARLLALALLACAVGCKDEPARSATAATSAPPPATDPSLPAVVFLGDSLTAGYQLAISEALPARIEQRFRPAGLELRVVNAGRSGDTSAGGLARLDWYLRPEVGLAALVVNLGSNDALRGLPLDQLEENLTRIIEKTKAARPQAPIFLVQLEMFPNLGRRFTGDYRAIFPRVAVKTGATLLPFPIGEVVLDPTISLGDGVHPNAAGVERLADAMWPALEPGLRELARSPR